MRFLFLLLLPFMIYAKSFTVASYNVENLFDDVNNGSEYEQYKLNTHNWTSEMAQIKLNHTAEAICDINSDIIGLQEIENAFVLRKLVAKIGECGLHYKHSAITKKPTAAVQVALLSKYPITKSRQFVITPNGRDRDILESVILVDGKELSIFVNHWKSKAKDGKESARIKSATILSNYLKGVKHEYIILGDLNSRYDESNRIEPRLNDTNGRTAINDVMKTSYNNILIDKSTLHLSPNGSHINLWSELPIQKRWNHEFRGEKSSLDHILLPRTMFDNRGVEYKDGSFIVFAPSYLLNSNGKIVSWSIKKKQHEGIGYSDHLPIRATFTTDKIKHNMRKTAEPIVKNATIDGLYRVERLQSSVKINNATVIWKRGFNALIKQSRNGRGVMLYGCARELQEGGVYDLQINEIKTYQGLKEITNLNIIKQKPSQTSTTAFMLPQSSLGKTPFMRQNEMFTNIQGVYSNGKLQTTQGSYSIYFKNRGKKKPSNGDKIKLLYAHLGYYKELQFVIYDKDDFEILE